MATPKNFRSLYIGYNSPVMKAIKRPLFIILGSLCLALGTIGIFLPVLPTTPFLLLAAFFFTRSSPGLHNWLMSHPIFGIYIYSYTKYKAVSRMNKVRALVLLWVGLGVSITIIPLGYVRVLLALIGIAVTIHIHKLRSLSPSEQAEFDAERRMLLAQPQEVTEI